MAGKILATPWVQEGAAPTAHYACAAAVAAYKAALAIADLAAEPTAAKKRVNRGRHGIGLLPKRDR